MPPLRKLSSAVLTAAGIAAAAASELPEAFHTELKTLFPEYGSVTRTGRGVCSIRSADGRELGRLYLELAPESEKTTGYNGPIEVALAVRGDRTVGVLIGKNRETPGFMRHVVRRGLLKQWNGATLSEVGDRPVDAVTGATMSSNAIITDVRRLAADHQKSASGTVPEPR